MKNLDEKAFKRSLFASMGRLIGVVLAGGAGSVLRQLVGNALDHWGTAILMALVGFVAIWITEYEKEIQ